MILKEKFVEKTDRYYFLDPFAAEFTYSDQKITFIGDATDNELVKGVVESVREIVSELGLLESLKTEIAPWSKKYEEMITRFEIEF